MVKRSFSIALSAFFLCFMPTALAAGEFVASVSSTQVPLNDTFSLTLTLKDASPKTAPDITTLKQYFLIHSQQNSTNTRIVNGKTSSSVTWKLSLTPKIEGAIQIPPITVATGEGLLATQPMTIHATKGTNLPSVTDSTGLTLTTQVSNSSPYKNEPFIYTATLTSKMPLYNVQSQKMQVEDAIVELVEEPKLEEKYIGGSVLSVVEFSYLITPLKAGTLTIAPIAIQSTIPEKRKGQFGAFFNSHVDPFAIMQGLDPLKPFTLMTDEVRLDVQPPIAEVSPWLPAKDLSLTEQWPSNQTLRVGEPFSRTFVVRAEGLKTTQLPRLEDLQKQQSAFKVYADKPEEQEKVSQGTIHSLRKEQYTLIPQQAGAWVLPEVSISWWDSEKKEKRTSTIPARTVDIQPALVETTPSVAQKSTTQEPIVENRPPIFLYGAIGVLVVALIIALMWAFALKRKIVNLTPHPIAPPKPTIQKAKKERLPDLNPT